MSYKINEMFDMRLERMANLEDIPKERLCWEIVPTALIEMQSRAGLINSLPWTAFDQNNWDEPGWIYCDHCGIRNKSNPNWYRRQRIYDAIYEDMKEQCTQLALKLEDNSPMLSARMQLLLAKCYNESKYL